MAGVAAGLLAGCAATAQPVGAQTHEWSTINRQQQAAIDPPGRVGRLSEVLGTVWLFHPEEGEWIAAVRNRPVTSGDRLSTEAGSRLELQIGSTTVRLDGPTDIDIERIDDDAIEIGLQAGTLALRVRNDDAARDLLLRTADGSFSPQRSGSYRLERLGDRSELSVLAGQAVYDGPQSAVTIYQGQRASFWIDAGGRAMYSLGQPRFDAFASWIGERDRLADAATAGRHVSPEMTGYQDLDRHGRWSEDPEYGAIWTPHQVPGGWAPYAAGHWAWVSPWGWTWVDDAPWGFAPFHYGRWIVVDNRWWWAPGRRVARPIYAPALVGWIGGSGASVSLTIGGGRGVGWFPLAPHEPYVPAYRVSRDYVRVVNGPHFRHPADIDRVIHTTSPQRGIEYRNRKFHHGTTTIPVEAFTRRGDDHRRVHVDPHWRRGDAARDLDRLPGSPVVTAPTPPWLGQGRDHRDPRGNRERPGGRRSADPVADGTAPFHRPGADGRADGSDRWRREERRFDQRRDEMNRRAREAEARGSPFYSSDPARGPAMIDLRLVEPGEQRGDGPGRGHRRGPDNPPAAPQMPAPVAPVVASPIEPPRPIMPVELERQRPPRAEQPERPFERGEQRGGRPDRGFAPPMPERAQPPAPIVQAPAPMMPPAPQMPAQPNRQIEPPRMMQPPPAVPEQRRMRAPRDPQAEPREDHERRRGGSAGRGTEQP
ncbi:DUF6600 domain-containing protein [Piscinibacter sakaiensis]|uniref:DUF6600 domain-containing protein n=1 Tax=Piscinibacter sakaiensis TaxID=1547922 RepID=UPI003AAE3E34